MTTVAETINAWLQSCTTEIQINTLTDFVQERLIIDEPTRQKLLQAIANKHNQRDWVRAKSKIKQPERFPATDEQPSDIIDF